MMKTILERLKKNRFNPNSDSSVKISDLPGIYIICLKLNSDLPKVSIKPEFVQFDTLNVIYVGISSKSLRKRDYKQHFNGNNAGKSTLRKSLGALFGYPQIARDSKSNKTKFNDSDEIKLSDWMKRNLVMYSLETVEYEKLEDDLIKYFNPPLNLKKNYSEINKEFRKLLSDLRTRKLIKNE